MNNLISNKICSICLSIKDKLHTKNMCSQCYYKERFRKNYQPTPRTLNPICESCKKLRHEVSRMSTKTMCFSCYNKEYKLKNKEKIIIQSRSWAIQNQEKLNERRKADRIKNPEKYKKQRENWLAKSDNRNRTRLQKHISYKLHIEKKRKLDKIRRNTPEHREKERIRIKEKYYNDPNYNFYAKMSRNIKYALGKQKMGRKWTTITGYDARDIQKHICSLFTENMTVEKLLNGEIHIDHNVPHVAFEYSSENDEAFKLCWSLNNLRPKWAYENFSKNDRLPNGFLARNLIYKIRTENDYNRVLNGGFPLADLTNYNCEI